ncbi:hypothetical protein JGK42_003875 [Aeromonas veronii]|nr:hypothetical protein [Aeromonas veronii]
MTLNIRYIHSVLPFHRYLMSVTFLLLVGCQHHDNQKNSSPDQSKALAIELVENPPRTPSQLFVTSTPSSAVSPLMPAMNEQITNGDDANKKTSEPALPSKILPTLPPKMSAEHRKRVPEKKELLPAAKSETKESKLTNPEPIKPEMPPALVKEPQVMAPELIEVPQKSEQLQKADKKEQKNQPGKRDTAPETEQKPKKLPTNAIPAPKIRLPFPTLPNIRLLPPSLPKIMPDIRAPNKYKHPLQHANKIIFMLGEDDAGYYLYGEGPLLAGAYEKMLRYVKFYQESGVELNRFMLHSPGGLVSEGLLIGNYIRKHNWTTDSDKYMRCYSSCGFIFASGVKKRIQQGAEIGFHRPYLPNKADTPDFIEQVYTEYKPYWNYIQGNPALYEIFMKQYGREDMYILRADTINQYMQIEVY